MRTALVLWRSYLKNAGDPKIPQCRLLLCLLSLLLLLPWLPFEPLAVSSVTVLFLLVDPTHEFFHVVSWDTHFS